MGAVIFNLGPPAALYCMQPLGLIPTSGAKGADAVLTPQLLVMIGKWTRSPTPWRDASGLMQRVLPAGSAQGIMLAPSGFLFPQASSTGVCGSQPFFLCSVSAGTSGL